MKLYEAHPQFHKVFEGRALIKFMEFDKQSALSLSNIREAAETIFQFSAKDEQVARILDKIFEKGLYPKASKAAKAKGATDAAKTEVGATEVVAETKVEPIVETSVKDAYARMRYEVEIHPELVEDLLAGPEKKLVESFEAKHAADVSVDPARLARSLENEFEKIQFLPGRKIGSVKVKDQVFELKANSKGKLELYESGKADAVVPAPKVVGKPGDQLDLFTPEGTPAFELKPGEPKPTPAPKPAEASQLDLFTEKQLNITAQEAALEAELAYVQEVVDGLAKGKIPKRYPVMDDVALGDQYFATMKTGARDNVERAMQKRIDDSMAANTGIITNEVSADLIQRGYLSALRKKAAGQGLEIGEFTITEVNTAKGLRYKVEAPIGKPVPKAVPLEVASPAPKLSPAMEQALQQPTTYKMGRYITKKVKEARALYNSYKTNPSPKTKLTLDKILKDNGVFVTKALGRGTFIDGTVEEQIASLEYAIVKIESLTEFPPDLTLPQEFLDWQLEQEKAPEKAPEQPSVPVQPSTGVGDLIAEGSPEDQEQISVSVDRVLDKWRSKDPGAMSSTGLKAALDIELSTFEKKTQGEAKFVRDGITITIGSDGKKSYEGLQEWIEDVPSKKKIGVLYKQAFEHGMAPKYYTDLNKGAAFKDSAELKNMMVKDLQDQILAIVPELHLTHELKVYSKSRNFTSTISPDKKVEVLVQDRWAEETFSRLANEANVA